MAFKTKTKNKHKNIDNRVTLDYKHKTKINEFKKKKEKNEAYKIKLNSLETKLNIFKENKYMNDTEIEDKLYTIDEIKELKGKISDNNKVVTNGGRVISVSSFGKNIKEALTVSYNNADKIQFDKKYYRKDLGFDL